MWPPARRTRRFGSAALANIASPCGKGMIVSSGLCRKSVALCVPAIASSDLKGCCSSQRTGMNGCCSAGPGQHRREAAFGDQGGLVDVAGERDRRAGAQRPAVDRDARGGDAVDAAQAIVGGAGGRVHAGLARRAADVAEAGVLDRQHVEAELPQLIVAAHVRARADRRRVAVQEEDPVAGAPAPRTRGRAARTRHASVARPRSPVTTSRSGARPTLAATRAPCVGGLKTRSTW